MGCIQSTAKRNRIHPLECEVFIPTFLFYQTTIRVKEQLSNGASYSTSVEMRFTDKNILRAFLVEKSLPDATSTGLMITKAWKMGDQRIFFSKYSSRSVERWLEYCDSPTPELMYKTPEEGLEFEESKKESKFYTTSFDQI
jgi:hypothetical protein